MIPLSGNAEIFKFANEGDEIEGIITQIEVQPVPAEFIDGKPVGQAVTKSGKPRTQWMVVLDTDSGQYRFYTSKWRMEKAITDAARKAGASVIDVGDFVGLKRVADSVDPKTKFKNQNFEAWFVPKEKDAVDSAQDAFGEDAAPF